MNSISARSPVCLVSLPARLDSGIDFARFSSFPAFRRPPPLDPESMLVPVSPCNAFLLFIRFPDPGTNKNGAGLDSLRHVNFSTYFQNIKSAGGKRTFSKLYISLRMNDLGKKPSPKGLDKFFAQPTVNVRRKRRGLA
jgi:hypothetical protein